ncbi:transcription elongation factor A protein 1-like [Panicum miliaceum]|uniref:Transcription elongation factor A protein 1-like n=1 Tax=Panicum miliaceum TaxID=4540 RepID=A0A3L6TNK3_PANMI|nr:transcription elongation factor A protein 1-like [Panicum miliaceum]
MASGPTCTFCSDVGDVLKKVARMNSKLVSEKDSKAVIESLRQLQAMPMTFEVLETTKIGRAINALKSAPSEKARELAAALYKGWRALADEYFVEWPATAPAASTGGSAESIEAPKVDKSITCSSAIKEAQSAGPNSSSGDNHPVTMTSPECRG